MIEIDPLPIRIGKDISAYIDILNFQEKQMQESIGIPADRLGIGCDPIKDNADGRHYTAMEAVETATLAIFKRINGIWEYITKPHADKRLPRKLKKLIKKKLKLGKVARKDLIFHHQVYKYAKYYNVKVKKEKP